MLIALIFVVGVLALVGILCALWADTDDVVVKTIKTVRRGTE